MGLKKKGLFISGGIGIGSSGGIGVGGGAGGVQSVILIPIWGQSNASGHLTSASDLPVYGVGAMANVKIWNWNLGSPVWQDLEVGVNNNRNDGIELDPNKFGPEIELGYRMQQQFGGIIYLVKVSKYASTMYQAGLNVWNAATVGGLTDQMIAIIIDARNNLIAAGKTVLIKAMYSMQGEGDGDTIPHAQAWPASKDDMVDKVRIELGLSSLMDVFGKVKYASGAGPIELRAQQEIYAAADPATRFIINTDGYSTSDGLHYTGVWQIKQGLDAYNIIKTFYP